MILFNTFQISNMSASFFASQIFRLRDKIKEMELQLKIKNQDLEVLTTKNQDMEQRSKVDQEQLKEQLNDLKMQLQQTLKAKSGDDQKKDDIITDLKSDLKKNVAEVERLRKSLNAKNELEGNQSETIKKLTDENKAWETESKKLKRDLEDNVEKVSRLEGAYRDMKKKLKDAVGEAAAAALSKEVSVREEAVTKLKEEKQRLELQVVKLQDSLQMTEASSEREDKLRQEVKNLKMKLEHRRYTSIEDVKRKRVKNKRYPLRNLGEEKDDEAGNAEDQ